MTSARPKPLPATSGATTSGPSNSAPPRPPMVTAVMLQSRDQVAAGDSDTAEGRGPAARERMRLTDAVRRAGETAGAKNALMQGRNERDVVRHQGPVHGGGQHRQGPRTGMGRAFNGLGSQAAAFVGYTRKEVRKPVSWTAV